MSDNITITQPDDDTFIPAVVGEGAIPFSDKLKKPYEDIQTAVKSAHGAKMDMWAAIFEFVVKTMTDEHKVEVIKICKKYNVDVNQGTKTDNEVKVTRGLKIALGVPYFVKGTPKTDKKDATEDAWHLEVPKSKISQYGAAFVLALETGKRTKDDFMKFVNHKDGGNGTMKRLVEKANEKDGGSSSKPITPEQATALKQAATALLKGKIDVSASDSAEEGTFKLIVNVDGSGKQTIMTAAKLKNDEAVQKELKSAAKDIDKDKLPKTTRECVAASLKLVKGPNNVELKYVNGKLVASTSNKDGERGEKIYPIGAAKNNKTQLKLDNYDIANVRRCLSVFSKDKTNWSIVKQKGKAVITVKPIGDMTMQDIIDAKSNVQLDTKRMTISGNQAVLHG